MAATTGLPVSTPFIIAVDYGTPSEEVCLVTAVAGTALTVTRAYDGTSGTSHNNGAPVRHTWSAIDGTEARVHEGSSSNVHGLAALSNVVGTTDTQTLTNKTLTSPAITSPTISGTIPGLGNYLRPTFTADTDLNSSSIIARRSATQTGNLTTWWNEVATTLASVDSGGVAHWTNGMKAGGTDQFSVNVSGQVTSSAMASQYVQDTTAVITTSTTYADGSPVASATITVPPSGKVLVMGRISLFNNTASQSTNACVFVSGSVSGTLRASTDVNSVRLGNGASQDITPGSDTIIITSSNIGETLTVKWQMRVTGGTGEIDYRSITLIPLMG